MTPSIDPEFELEAVADGIAVAISMATNLRPEHALSQDQWLVLGVVLAEAARNRMVDIDISLNELVEHLLLIPRGGVPRHRVRQSLKELHRRGIVEYEPGTGSRVSRVSLRPLAFVDLEILSGVGR